jgi:predicted outer membrane repeat protein
MPHFNFSRWIRDTFSPAARNRRGLSRRRTSQAWTPQLLEERRMLAPVGYGAANSQPSLAMNYIICVNGQFPQPDSALSDEDGPFVGEVRAFGGNLVPENWMPCRGALLPVAQYRPLFTLLSTTYGGDGIRTFGLPDLSGRTVVGSGQGNGLTNREVGAAFGNNTISLNSVDDYITARQRGAENTQPSLPMSYRIAEKGSSPEAVGQVRLFACNSQFFTLGRQPDGTQLSPSTSNPLFSQLGNAYGGDGKTKFSLPDLRGRTIVGSGPGPLSQQTLGKYVGSEKVRLGATGDFANVQPSLVMNYMIAVDGLFQQADGSSPMIGEVRAYSGTKTPSGWVPCDGRTLPLQPNVALYSVIGTNFGGNGSSNFAVPDLRGRVLVGAGSGIQGDFNVGETFGTEKGQYLRNYIPPFVVSTLDDVVNATDGKTSLREAITAASLIAGPDQVIIRNDPTSPIPQTFVLKRENGPLVFFDTTGTTQLVGPGADTLTITGGDATQLVVLGPKAQITLAGLTLTRGKGDQGGAVFCNEGSTLSLQDVTISNSTADNGGGIYSGSASLTLKNVTFRGNKATGKGGGLYVNSPQAQIDNCTFVTNTAVSGAGLYNQGTMNFFTSTVDGNNAVNGAGIYNAGKMNSPDSIIANNDASQAGGGYYNARGATLTILRDTINGNEALRDGGGIVNLGVLTVDGAIIEDNEATRRNGGGLANFGTADVEGGTFRRNDAGLDGGGVSNAKGAKLDLTGVSLIQNDAGHDGGAIFDRGLEEIIECELVGNTAENAGAGFFELGGIGETFLNSIVEDGNQVTGDPETALGSAAGVVGTVQLRDDETNQTTLNFQPYDATFKGGVRVATGYLPDKDGVPTQVIVTAPASGMAPLIKVFDAFSGNLIRTITGAATLGSKGVSLAVGDVTGDGLDDVVVGSGPGVKSLVVVYDGATGKALKSLAPFAATFPGGINVAVGDTTGDGTDEIVVGAGSGAAAPGVAVLSFATGKQLTGWGLDATKFTGGVNVAVVDRNGDGYGDVVAAQAAGGSRITIFDGRGPRTPLAVFNAYYASYVGGVNIAADDVDGDGLPDLVVSPARGNTVKVVAFNPRTFKPIEAFTADKNFTKGIYLG